MFRFLCLLPLLLWQPRTIAFVGDSLTLAQPGYVGEIESITGDITHRFVPYHLQDAIDMWPDVWAVEPDIIIIELGIHSVVGCDVSAHEFGARFDELLRLSTGTARTIVVNVPALWDTEPEVNETIDKFAALHNVAVVDAYSATVDCTECIGPDGFHPSDIGYHRIAVAILERF